MKGNVNPFQPWRPAELEVPPPLHAGRPWRPPASRPTRVVEEEPPFVEPIDPPAGPPERKRRPPKPARCKRPAQSSTLDKPDSELRADQKVVLGMYFTLGILTLVGLASLGGTHLPRIAAALTAVGVGFTIGISRLYQRAWFVRLGWMAAALALAGLAGWFVPTTSGVNLWSAYQRVDELRALPAGDVAGYVRGAPARKEMTAEFPTFTEDVRTTEQAWFRRTVDAAIEEADRQLATDPDKALMALHQLDTQLSSLEHYALVRGELESARQRAVQASLKAARP
jgi:hypothetical protein